MSNQLHKNFTDKQVKSLLKSYLDKEIKISYILQILKIKRRRFFELLAKYHKDPDNFSIQYARKTINRKIAPDIERNIVKELKVEKDLIKNKEVPVKYYNYSYIKDLLEQKYSQRVSLPTWSSPDKTDTQLSDHGHFFVFLRAIIPYRRM